MEGDEARLRGERLKDALAEPMGRKRIRSYAALARLAGLRPNTLTDWWTVGKVPSGGALLRVAEVLDLSLSDLLDAYQAIPWWGDSKSIARRLLTCTNKAYVFIQEASLAKTAIDEYRLFLKYDATACSGIANELRIAIGLPPVPIN